MSQHNYTNPAFCQQSEFYPTQTHTSSPLRIQRSESSRSLKYNRRGIINERLQPQQHREIPPTPGPKPQNVLFNRQNSGARYHHITNNSNNNNNNNINNNGGINIHDTTNNNSGRYALVPVEEIPKYNKGRYTVLPVNDTKFLQRSLSTINCRYTKSQDNIDQQSTGSSEATTENEDSFTSLPPLQIQSASSAAIITSTHQRKTTSNDSRLKSAFSSDFSNNKSLILVDQKNMQRYAIVPTEDNEEIVDANQEFIQMHNGRAHRYAVIPTDEEETCLSNELEISTTSNHNYATIKENPTPVTYPTNNNANFNTVIRNNNSGNSFRRKNTLTTNSNNNNNTNINNNNINNSTNNVNNNLKASPQKRQVIQKPINTTPNKNSLATQKLHEILQTPRKQMHYPTSPPQEQIQYTPAKQQSMTSSSYYQQNANIISSTPKCKTEFTPQKLEYADDDDDDLQRQQQMMDQRTTAIISPRLASLASSAVYTSNHHPHHAGTTPTAISGSWNKSWNNLSLQKVANATATIGVVSCMLILCGAMNSGLCLYMITGFGKSIHLDVGILSGFSAIALGLLGYRSRHSDWLPNRNYISGFILVTVFSLFNCCGLLILLALHPLPGTSIHDFTTGILLGLSSLILLLISLGVITSRWCRAPPPDNRVNVY